MFGPEPTEFVMDDEIKETIARARITPDHRIDRKIAMDIADECERLQAILDKPTKMLCMWCHADTTDWPRERVCDHIFGCEKAPHAKLYARLSQYECPQHPEPKFGECDECDKHAQDEEWMSPQL